MAAAALLGLMLAGTAYAQGEELPLAEPAAEESVVAAPEDSAMAEPTVAESAVPEAEVENPYGLSAAWNQGDAVSKGAFVILGIMSAATWYILIVKLIEQSKIQRQGRDANQSFWGGKPDASVQELKDGSAFRHVAEVGINASRHHAQLAGEVDRSSWIQYNVGRAIDDIQGHLQGGLAVLATVGSTAPFVGLFGTVWGIYHALTAIGISGQASIDKVAGPVGEALIMTALGLAVAVPAVLGYNWLVRRNKAALETVRTFSTDLHSVLLSGSRVSDAAAK